MRSTSIFPLLLLLLLSLHPLQTAAIPALFTTGLNLLLTQSQTLFITAVRTQAASAFFQGLDETKACLSTTDRRTPNDTANCWVGPVRALSGALLFQSDFNHWFFGAAKSAKQSVVRKAADFPFLVKAGALGFLLKPAALSKATDPENWRRAGLKARNAYQAVRAAKESAAKTATFFLIKLHVMTKITDLANWRTAGLRAERVAKTAKEAAARKATNFVTSVRAAALQDNLLKWNAASTIRYPDNWRRAGMKAKDAYRATADAASRFGCETKRFACRARRSPAFLSVKHYARKFKRSKGFGWMFGDERSKRYMKRKLAHTSARVRRVSRKGSVWIGRTVRDIKNKARSSKRRR